MQRYEKNFNYTFFPITDAVWHTVIDVFFNVLSFSYEVAIVRLFFVGGQCDLEFPVGSILDGADRKIEIGFDSNIHSFCVLWRRQCLFSSVKIHKYVSNSDKICNFALEKNVGCLSSAIPRYRKTQ